MDLEAEKGLWSSGRRSMRSCLECTEVCVVTERTGACPHCGATSRGPEQICRKCKRSMALGIDLVSSVEARARRTAKLIMLSAALVVAILLVHLVAGQFGPPELDQRQAEVLGALQPLLTSRNTLPWSTHALRAESGSVQAIVSLTYEPSSVDQVQAATDSVCRALMAKLEDMGLSPKKRDITITVKARRDTGVIGPDGEAQVTDYGWSAYFPDQDKIVFRSAQR